MHHLGPRTPLDPGTGTCFAHAAFHDLAIGIPDLDPFREQQSPVPFPDLPPLATIVPVDCTQSPPRFFLSSQGLTVSRLKRVRYGEIFIPSMVKQGQWIELPTSELKSLYRMADMPMKEVRRGSVKEREIMERQFGKRKGRGVAKKTTRSPGGR